jgi:hypothetical protein
LTPGARTLIQAPKLENKAKLSLTSVAPVVIEEKAEAGV